MKKILLSLFCLCLFPSVYADDIATEQAKYTKIRKEAMKKYMPQNVKLQELHASVNVLNEELMNLAINLNSNIANAEVDARWKELVKNQASLIEKSTKFKNAIEKRRQLFVQMGELLSELEPKLREQGKRIWEAKQKAQI
ncbi:hypothetical protein PQO03_00890 [Lentisphaera profundi]|uniref:Periplasmic heavy metal sensor n=1 Tax=Lentisphaera profundi TaxID=1658616 RepID=A0ABY7VUL3_9BACT|nr:hypothetical protein [Lentisphaera profundi]WDE96521.1 hypothetical protein PQO03_00890 [Lentisphaera profundi]